MCSAIDSRTNVIDFSFGFPHLFHQKHTNGYDTISMAISIRGRRNDKHATVLKYGALSVVLAEIQYVCNKFLLCDHKKEYMGRNQFDGHTIFTITGFTEL